jgi:hypothetical protein
MGQSGGAVMSMEPRSIPWILSMSGFVPTDAVSYLFHVMLHALTPVYPDLAILHVAREGEVAGIHDGGGVPIGDAVEIEQVVDNGRPVASALVLRAVETLFPGGRLLLAGQKGHMQALGEDVVVERAFLRLGKGAAQPATGSRRVAARYCRGEENSAYAGRIEGLNCGCIR